MKNNFSLGKKIILVFLFSLFFLYSIPSDVSAVSNVKWVWSEFGCSHNIESTSYLVSSFLVNKGTLNYYIDKNGDDLCSDKERPGSNYRCCPEPKNINIGTEAFRFFDSSFSTSCANGWFNANKNLCSKHDKVDYTTISGINYNLCCYTNTASFLKHYTEKEGYKYFEDNYYKDCDFYNHSGATLSFGVDFLARQAPDSVCENLFGKSPRLGDMAIGQTPTMSYCICQKIIRSNSLREDIDNEIKRLATSHSQGIARIIQIQSIIDEAERKTAEEIAIEREGYCPPFEVACNLERAGLWFLEKILKFILFLWAVIGFLVGFVISLSIIFFGSIIGPILSIPITSGVEIVNELWFFVRDFANIFFLLSFVIIGLATILRIENYKFQKTLPLLIIMALLVNFSLVLVGFVVDIGNILTSLFLDSIQGYVSSANIFSENIWNAKNTGMDLIDRSLGATRLIQNSMAAMATLITSIIIGLFAAIIFFILVFVLIFRLAILWVIAIVSPIAFVSYIFPSTRSMIWDRWLKNLIQWSFISVPILFFTYIGFFVMESNPSRLQDIGDVIYLESTGDLVPIAQIIQTSLVPFVGVLIMLIGLLITKSIMPEGAEKTVNFGKKAGLVMTGAGIAAAGKGMTAAGNLTPIKKTKGNIARRMEGTMIGRNLGFKPGSQSKKEKTEQESLEKEMSTMKEEDIINATKQTGNTGNDASTAGLRELAKRGKLTPEIYSKLIPKAKKSQYYNNGAGINSAVPTLIENNSDFEKTISSMNVDDFSKLHPDVLKISKNDSEQTKERKRKTILEITNKGPAGVDRFMRSASSGTVKSFSESIQNNNEIRSKVPQDIKNRIYHNPNTFSEKSVAPDRNKEQNKSNAIKKDIDKTKDQDIYIGPI